MKDLGSIQYFLGIEIVSSPKGYLLSQSKYIIDIVDHAHLIDTTLKVNVQYSSSNGNPLLEPALYRTIVGSLVYLTITRSNITNVVHNVSQFVAFPTTFH